MYILKKIRQELKLTAQEFGDLLGVSQSTIYNYEYGHRRPGYYTWIKKIFPALRKKGYHLSFEDLR